MEEQVPSSAVPLQAPQQPAMPNFEEMRRIAMQQAIEQVTAQRPAASQPPASFVPPQAPPGMELSMDGSQYIPKKYPDNATQPVLPQPQDQVRVVRRNLTRPELLAIFVVACIAVTGVQAAWNFTTNILPRIEIRAN